MDYGADVSRFGKRMEDEDFNFRGEETRGDSSRATEADNEAEWIIQEKRRGAGRSGSNKPEKMSGEAAELHTLYINGIQNVLHFSRFPFVLTSNSLHMPFS
jgi:hypothetical protein